ncbi:MAG TPA: ABC transporter permease [Phycisphaerae bacterium]|nr:ABC transporter permease [Phycisphaerae bacterium]HRR84183.1 ABC transporter permease [Phycisphaerae bacterium]
MISRLPVAGLVVVVGAFWPAAEEGRRPSGAEAVSIIRERFEEDHGRICSFGSRFAGQPGCEQTAAYIESEMKAAGVSRIWRRPVELVVPVTDHADLAVNDEPPVPIDPLWPNGANPCVTPPEGFTSEAVYIGEGELEALPVDRLSGRIAVMEFNTGDRWQYAAMHGALAVLFLRPQDTSWTQANGKYMYASVPFPRFYVNDAALSDRLRRDGSLKLTVRSLVRWQRRTVDNLIGYIPAAERGDGQAVAVLHSRYDAACAVPDLAFGAEQAINPAVLLQLVRGLAARPPAYGVLAVFTCGDTFELAASRQLMKSLTDAQAALGGSLAAEEQELGWLREYRQKLAGSDVLGAVAGWSNRRFRNEHVIWQVKYQILQLQAQARRQRKGGEDEAALASIDQRRIRMLALQRQLHQDRPDEMDANLLGDLLPDVQRRLDRMIADRKGRLERRRVDMDILRTVGLGAGSASRPILFISLELSSHGRQFAPFAQSHLCEQLVQNRLVGYGEWLRHAAERIDLPAEVRRTYLDDAAEGRRHWQSDLPAPVANGIDAAVSAGCLGMMMATTQDMRLRVDTPMDTQERTDLDRLAPQIAMCGALIDEMLRRPMPLSRSPLSRWFCRWAGIAAMPAPGEGRLDLGIPDAVLYAKSYLGAKSFGTRGIGVRDAIVVMTDGEGRFDLDDIFPEKVRWAPLRSEVYRFDALGRVNMAMTRLGTWETPASGHARMADRINLRGEMFECAQIGLFGLHDARYLEDLDKVLPVEVPRGSEPRAWNFAFDEGAFSVFLPTDVDRWQLVFARGDATRRMLVLNADPDEPEGRGFPLEWRQTEAIGLTSARDFALLNTERMARLEGTGVIDPYLRELHAESRKKLAAAEAALASGDGAAAARETIRALAGQARVYQLTRSATDDAIHAVLLILVCLVPFSYFLERLLVAAAGIYRQIGGFTGILAVMVILITLFHPAFRISLTPVTILLAFVILFLSVLVIAIVLGRFHTELRHLRRGHSLAESGAGGASAGDFRRFAVLNRAMLLGIANMRRRKMRTALTLVTLVLLSFLMMSFTGSGMRLHPLRYELTRLDGGQEERSAIMIQRMSCNPMPVWTLDYLGTAYRERAEVLGHWWITYNSLTTQATRTLRLDGPGGRHALLPAVSCIDPREARLLGMDRLAGDDGMATFAASRDAILISSSVAERIAAKQGDRVEMLGSPFTVAGIMDDRGMLSLTGLNGRAYAPLDYSRYLQWDPDPTLLQSKLDLIDSADSTADLTGSARSEPYHGISPDQFAIIRADRAVELGGSLRSVVIVPHDPRDTMALADDVAVSFRQPVYANADGKVVLCAMAELTTLQGFSSVIVPLLIGAAIIFNTMLSSVYERRREIGTMMAVGLAPLHVGALFVAEAAAYGTIGVVGGFVLGQGLGTVAARFDLIPGINLNFSSAAAVWTQVAMMAVVLLSSLWPACKAARIAAPGSESTWKLPVPHGDEMAVLLPFTFHGRDAAPLLVYLREWLASHTESSLGRFTCGAIELFADAGTGGRGLVAQIWLAPFDLGIMQTVELEIRPGSDPSIHEVRISLRREAGPHSSWVRGNRRFLTELRKRFLLWRSLSPAETERYRGEIAIGA